MPLLALIALLVLLALLAGFLLLRRRPPARPPVSPQPRLRSAEAAPASAAAPPSVELPPELLALRQGFQLTPAAQLDERRRRTLMEALQRLPRPPRALQELVSPDFIQRASSAQLSDVVMGEPAIAARVMAAVNSPLYGLQQPVTSIGQAITFLGLASVRAQCLQHLLDDSFKISGNPALQREFAVLWRASAAGAELCQLLATRLRLGDPGALVTLVVLSFLGRFAATTLMQRVEPVAAPAGLLGQYRQQQDTLGLAAPELGVMLMQEWDLPAHLAEDVARLGRLPLTPATALPAELGARLALCAFSARLGERIARGELRELNGFDPLSDAAPDFQALRDHLARPALAGLGELLRSPEGLRLLGRLSH